MASRILIVEDNADAAQTLLWAMEASGYDVRVALDGVSALETVESYTPQAVVCDLNMPGMNGYDVCDVMRQDPKLKDTTFIAHSGWGSELHREAARIHGFHYHLPKPLDFKRLRRILGKAKPA